MNKLITFCILMGSLFIGPLAYGQDDPVAAEVKTTVTAWLATIDEGHYDDSWTAAAEGFRLKTSKAKWSEVVQRVRVPLGVVKTREFVSVREVGPPKKQVPGKYREIKYQTAFAQLPSSTETVVVSLEPSGKWCVASYTIRPDTGTP